MLKEAQTFWEAIKNKVVQVCRNENKNSLNVERYIVTTPPNGSVMGVTLPFGTKEIMLPYSQEVAGATVENQVLVAWWGSMSNAKVYYYANGYDGELATVSVPTSDFFLTNPFPTPGNTVTVNRNGRVVSVYIRWTSSNVPAADTMECISVAYRPNIPYVIIPIYSSASPYIPVGSIWINGGRLRFYGDDSQATGNPGADGGYAYVTYLT